MSITALSPILISLRFPPQIGALPLFCLSYSPLLREGLALVVARSIKSKKEMNQVQVSVPGHAPAVSVPSFFSLRENEGSVGRSIKYSRPREQKGRYRETLAGIHSLSTSINIPEIGRRECS